MRLILPLLLLIAMPSYAEEDSLTLTVFHSMHPQKPKMDPRVNFDLTKDWHFTFFKLPLLAPLAGARLEDGSNIPNPFDLTGGIPYTNVMPPWLSDRSVEVDREYRRIEMTSSGRFKLTLTSDGSH